MSNNIEKFAVFIDTSCLSKIHYQDPNFVNLLELAKQEKIILCMSKVVCEEWRSQHRDDLIEMAHSIKTIINKFNTIFSNNLFTVELQNDVMVEQEGLVESYLLSKDYFEFLDRSSKEKLSQFLEKNKIQLVDYDGISPKKTCDAYFSGGPPFRRAKEKQDIPDSWIYEAARISKQQHGVLYCIIQDKRLRKSLENECMTIFENIKAFVDFVSKQQNLQEKNSESIFSKPMDSVENISNTNLDKKLKELDISQRAMKEKILGYINFPEPLTKKDLYDLLAQDQYSMQLVENVAQQLVLNGLIIDTGNYYLPNLTTYANLFEEVKKRILPNVLGMLDEDAV